MKIISRIHRLLFFIAFVVMGLAAGASEGYSYPSPPGGDSSGGHFDIRNNNDHGNGSLRTALEEGCRKEGTHLVEFGQFANSSQDTTIHLESQLSIPTDCKGTFEFAGLTSREMIIDGSSLPQGSEPSGKECSLFMGSGNHSLRYMTFTGAPFGICAFGNNITIQNSFFGVKRDGSKAGNAAGVFISGNTNKLYYNVFGGNSGDGLVIRGHENQIQANYFGVLSGNVGQDKGNGGAGIKIIGSGSKKLIGGGFQNHANVIRFNKKGGVVLAGPSDSPRNKISHNKIALNTGLGIDILGDGVTFPSTSQDGPNKLMSLPANVQVGPLQTSSPTRFLFRGKAPTNVSGDIYVEVYVSDPGEPSDSAPRAKEGAKPSSNRTADS